MPPTMTLSRMDSDVSSSKPCNSNKLPSTRRTFQPGRVSAKGAATPLKLCTRPSALTKVPEVSVNGEIGSMRSEEHTSELQSLMRISYAVFCLKKKKIISS